MPLSGNGQAALYTGPSGDLSDARTCSGPNVDVSTDKAAAVSNRMYFSGPVCYKTLRIQYQDKTADVPIVDQCISCEQDSIQISKPAFDELGVDPTGGAILILWTIVDEDSDANSTESASETPSFTESTSPEPSSQVTETESQPPSLAAGAIAGIAVAAVAALALVSLLLFFILRSRRRRRRRRDTDELHTDETLDPAPFGLHPKPPTPPSDKAEPPPPPQPAQPELERSESRSNHSREEVAQLHAAMRQAGFSVPGIIASLRDGAPPAYDDLHATATNR